MAEFETNVVRISQPVVDHPNADRLSIVKIGGYECISGKLEDGTPRYKEGDFVVYVPEGAVMPEYLLKTQGFWNKEKNCGMLAGSGGDRVKAIKLRGIVSQGILIPVSEGAANTLILIGDGVWAFVKEGQDVSKFLGITKYEPPIPATLAGSVARVPHPGTVNVGTDVIVKYDFENIKKHPDMFSDGEMVYLTEKIHGTFCQFGYIPGLNHEEGFGDWFVASKGLGKQGLCFQNLPENTSNVYVKTFKKIVSDEFKEKMAEYFHPLHSSCVWIFGEIYGNGIQDLSYGLQNKEYDFRIFDVKVRYMSNDICAEYFLDKFLLADFCETFNINHVPILAVGRYSEEFVNHYRDGKTVLGGEHIREGVVIRHQYEIHHPKYGRKIAKAVSPDYLLRKGGTEYN